MVSCRSVLAHNKYAFIGFLLYIVMCCIVVVVALFAIPKSECILWNVPSGIVGYSTDESYFDILINNNQINNFLINGNSLYVFYTSESDGGILKYNFPFGFYEYIFDKSELSFEYKPVNPYGVGISSNGEDIYFIDTLEQSVTDFVKCNLLSGTCTAYQPRINFSTPYSAALFGDVLYFNTNSAIMKVFVSNFTWNPVVFVNMDQRPYIALDNNTLFAGIKGTCGGAISPIIYKIDHTGQAENWLQDNFFTQTMTLSADKTKLYTIGYTIELGFPTCKTTGQIITYNLQGYTLSTNSISLTTMRGDSLGSCSVAYVKNCVNIFTRKLVLGCGLGVLTFLFLIIIAAFVKRTHGNYELIQ